MQNFHKHIVVFAGNECRQEKEEHYYSLAYDMGMLLSKEGFVVVTGGGPGLMNEVMRGAYESKGRTIGICLAVAGRIQSKFITKRYMFRSLHSRIKKLISIGDHFIAIPGGVGTTTEIMTVLDLKRRKKISQKQKLILVDAYYHEFESLIEKMKKEGFAGDDIDSFYTVVKDPFAAIEILKHADSQI